MDPRIDQTSAPEPSPKPYINSPNTSSVPSEKKSAWVSRIAGRIVTWVKPKGAGAPPITDRASDAAVALLLTQGPDGNSLTPVRLLSTEECKKAITYTRNLGKHFVTGTRPPDAAEINLKIASECKTTFTALCDVIKRKCPKENIVIPATIDTIQKIIDSFTSKKIYNNPELLYKNVREVFDSIDQLLITHRWAALGGEDGRNYLVIKDDKLEVTEARDLAENEMQNAHKNAPIAFRSFRW
ncbi:MAG: hypothetical protein WCF65_09840 [Parachlamydiaceae bacterium]